ncbi:hypothetical protein EXN66_Car021348 [Channa argus]|uniref:Uncharacterized protein n=1 Tax=Channa argus TaxID=215402 RepID=A0A6G1QT50_CHAAH|nr:hypothetical protein EXN66_Car021348 [Channa argus]
MLSKQEDGHKVIDIQTPNVSPSTQSAGSANSSGRATDLFSNSPIVPINNQGKWLAVKDHVHQHQLDSYHPSHGTCTHACSSDGSSTSGFSYDDTPSACVWNGKE